MACYEVTPARLDGIWGETAADLVQYHQIARAVHDLERQKPTEQLSAARHAIQRLHKELADERAPHTHMKRVVEEEEHELKDMYYPGKLLGLDKPLPLVGMFHEMKIKEHEEVLKGLKEERDEQQRQIRGTKGKLAQAQKKAAGWQEKVKALSIAQKEQQRVLERICAAPGWEADERVLAVKAEQSELRERAMQAEAAVSAHSSAKKTMEGAVLKLVNARYNLRQMKIVEKMHVMKDRKGKVNAITVPERSSKVADAVPVDVVVAANAFLQGAAMELTQVRNELLPAMPGLDEALLRSAMAGLFQDVLYTADTKDGMVQTVALHDGMAQVDRFEAQAKQALAWVKDSLAALEEEAHQLRTAATGKDAELVAYKKARVELAASTSACLISGHLQHGHL